MHPSEAVIYQYRSTCLFTSQRSTLGLFVPVWDPGDGDTEAPYGTDSFAVFSGKHGDTGKR